MAKKAKKSASKKSVVQDAASMVRIADIVAIVSSVWFMNSVAMNTFDMMTKNMKDSPASYAAAIGAAAIVYSFMSKKRLSFSTSFCVGILVASMFIWTFGLSR